MPCCVVKLIDRPPTDGEEHARAVDVPLPGRALGDAVSAKSQSLIGSGAPEGRARLSRAPVAGSASRHDLTAAAWHEFLLPRV